jgi:hypothetical protein
MKQANIYFWKALALILAISIHTSCGSTKTSQGATTGAIVGGLVDGWGGAATGALIGGGIGLMSDTADDKKKQQEQKDRELALLEKSTITSDSKTAYSPENSSPLTGSTWRVISLVDEKNTTPDFATIILTFQTNSRATTLILWQDGRSETYGETYSVVLDVLVFTGKDYVTNTKYTVNNKQMVMVSPTMRVVLEEVEEGI